jgi:CheY-like chemotaxis protein
LEFGHLTVDQIAMLPRAIRLLVVEDSTAFQYLIQDAFRDRGEIRWELTLADDGEEALRLLFEEENEDVPLPNLILLDWNLPKVSGSEVLQRIKRHDKLRRIPVLVFRHRKPTRTSTPHTTITPTDIFPSLKPVKH